MPFLNSNLLQKFYFDALKIYIYKYKVCTFLKKFWTCTLLKIFSRYYTLYVLLYTVRRTACSKKYAGMIYFRTYFPEGAETRTLSHPSQDLWPLPCGIILHPRPMVKVQNFALLETVIMCVILHC